MNILAHLYLSKTFNQAMIGNYIGDFVKGNQYLRYPDEVQKGILFHRQIDRFTDAHPIHKKSRDHFRPAYGLYAGIVTDIIYDYFLAKNWKDYHEDSLADFAHNVYRFLKGNWDLIPGEMQYFASFMIKNNWLVLYSQLDGIERVLNGMARNTSLPQKTAQAMEIIQQEAENLQKEFTEFFLEINKMFTV